MKVVIKPLYERLDEVDPEQYDVFKRRRFKDNLTDLLKNTNDGLVFTINSEWGAGKTSFIKIWEKELAEDEQFIPIYYNAFKNDFTNEVFLSIAVEIQRALDVEMEKAGKDSRNAAQLRYLKKQAKKLAIDLVRVQTGAGITTLSHGLLPGTKIAQMLFNTLRINTEQKFDAHLRLQKTIEDYQEQLRKMLVVEGNDKPKKIVFFVDELDRCRPDFAVEVIEKIKHLFSVENVSFVLAINRQQLMKSIEHAYGLLEEDCGLYLQKFIHFETNLPPIDFNDNNEGTLHSKLSSFVGQLIGLHELSERFEKDKNTGKNIMVDMMTAFNDPIITPRAVERILSLVAIAIGSSEGKLQNDKTFFQMLCAMAVVKIMAHDLYDYWKKGIIVRSGKYGSSGENLLGKMKKHFRDSVPRSDVGPHTANKDVKKVCSILDIYAFPKVFSASSESYAIFSVKAEPSS